MKNVTVNRKEGTTTVYLPTGKIKVYKRNSSAITFAEKNQIKINIPDIVTANTYFWTSSSNASSRRSNEKRRQGEIDGFANRLNVIPTIEVKGTYNESCKNVYKGMTYKILRKDSWKETNITGLIGEAARWGIELVK